MKIIQSFWSGKKDCKKDSYSWLSAEFHLLSWTLSCLQLRNFYNDVTLFTDNEGYEILIKQLQLPYTNVVVNLDKLNHYPPSLWALAKIKAYSMMDETFIHIDGDVFIWGRIDRKLESHDILVQNFEVSSDYYKSMWYNIRPHLNYIPNSIEPYDKQINLKACNMGIFGCTDINFLNKYCSEVFKFVNHNWQNLDSIKLYNFNIFFEQVLLNSLAIQQNKRIAKYIEKSIGDNEYEGFADFEEVPEKKYLHLIGCYKKHFISCNKMRNYVLENYPQYYYKIENLLWTDNYREKPSESLLFCKEVYTLNSLRKLKSNLAKDENFIIEPISCYSVRKNYIMIEFSNGYIHRIEKLSIDRIIFKIINRRIDRKSIEFEAMKYVEKDTSQWLKDKYISIMWERVKYLVACGLFLIS